VNTACLDADACTKGLLRDGEDPGGFPRIHQTFNLVPSLVMQIEEYASGSPLTVPDVGAEAC